MDHESKIGDLLSSHGLKKTPIRIEILNIFMQHHFALSTNDLVEKLSIANDRVTIYRALISFESHGILHKASEDRNGIKYALCNHTCPPQTHSDQHVHFICEACNQTLCMEEVVIPEVEVSPEFSVNKVNYTLTGICPACKD